MRVSIILSLVVCLFYAPIWWFQEPKAYFKPDSKDEKKALTIMKHYSTLLNLSKLYNVIYRMQVGMNKMSSMVENPIQSDI